ncbi:MAG: dihydroorotase [Propionibacteriaceae bacterium]|nr:dihydroorotase [Propionibacteriaceae bacterium]
MNSYSIIGVHLPDTGTTDLFVQDGRLVAQAPLGAQRIDAEGLIALPGLVDPHTHLREPGGETSETIATGTAAAAHGGYTAVLAMPNTNPAIDTPAKADALLRRAVLTGARAQVVPIGAVTADRDGQHLADLAGMADFGVRVFSDDGTCVADPSVMRAALHEVARFDGVIAEHAQDPWLAGPDACCSEDLMAARLGVAPWPAVAESVIVARDVQLAQEAGARLHICHVSTPESVEILRWAKARGVRVTAEVTPHHLLLDAQWLAGGDTTFKVNPPLRPPADLDVLRDALAQGIIDMVGTDHAPHCAADKAGDLASALPGVTGLEQALAVVMDTMLGTGRGTWSDVARWMSYAPAALAHLSGQGRPLTPGEPATLVLVDPTRRAVVDRRVTASASQNNPYDGFELPDPVVLTMRAGMITYRR